MTGTPTPIATRLSQFLAVAGALLIGAVGTARFLKDGSFWMDEASIALNLLRLDPFELFGALELNQNFPRLYLLAIKGLEQAFGFETKSLRFLPFLFFLLATILWQRLLYLRLREVPALLAVAIALSLIPTTWFVYSAMLKQYSFDVFLALIPFSISDGFFRRTLREGERSWRLLALILPCAASYTYGIILLGRLTGWYVGELKHAGFRLHPRSFGILLVGLATFSASLWWTDFRTAPDLPTIFWKMCLLGNDWSASIPLLNRFAFGWYQGNLEFHQVEFLAESVLIVIHAAFALGLIGIGINTLRKTAGSRPTAGIWGTRSLGCVACVAGVLLASVVLQYTICAGRLTLFVLPSLQIITLEGLHLVYRAAQRLPWGRVLAPALALVLLASLGPASLRNAKNMIRVDVPENIRSVLHHIDDHEAVPILVNFCMRRQAEALPEGLGEQSVRFLDSSGSVEEQLPWGEQVLFLSPRFTLDMVCRAFQTRILENSTSWEALYSEENTVALFLVEFPEKPEPGSRNATQPGSR